MSKYAEIRGSYYDDTEGKQFVDAWFTDNDNEEGVVIAKIDFANKTVEYLDEDAKTDEYAQEVINELLNERILNEEKMMDIKEAAKGLVAFCIRNNTVLENYHAQQVPITNERMKQFMKDCVNNVFFVLTGLCVYDDIDVFENMMELLKGQSQRYAQEWDEPKFPEWYDRLVNNNAEE